MMLNRIKKMRLKEVVLFLAAFMYFAASSASAAPGNAENGKTIYMKKCWWCHGKEGEADGPGAEFMIPPPRDFSLGMYKYKTSTVDRVVVRDEDIFDMITYGMPGTSMPSWKEVLNDQERWDLVAFVKSLTDMFEGADNPPALDLSKKVSSSADSIEKGKKAYDDAKCWECHGKEGKGDLMKKLKEDSGSRVWPRNLAKPWTFRVSNNPEDIYARVTNGIPGTPMTSFAAETTGNGKLSEEDRWHVSNYVASLADPNRATKQGQIVVKAIQTEALPADENDPAWEGFEGTAYFLVPQIIAAERFFIPSNDLVIVKAAFTENEIAFLLEIDDRTKSVPGNSDAAAIAWGNLTPDALAIQTPVVIPDSAEKPYFGHGDASHPVSMLYWNSGSTESGQIAKMMTTTGLGKMEASDVAAAGFTATSTYNAGTWKVMMKRSLATNNPEKDTQFVAGKYIPIAFANWDGSNGEAGSKHTMTTWYWLLLKPQTGSSVVLLPLAVLLVLVGGQVWISGRMKNKA